MRCAWTVLAMVGCGSVKAPIDVDAPGGGSADADGVVAPGTVRWVRSLSALGALGLADGAGGLVVAGYIAAPANLGGTTLVPSGGATMVIAGLDRSDASHLYSIAHGGAGNAYGFLHDVTANGTPLVYGVSSGSVDLGRGVEPGGSLDGTVNPPEDGYIGLYTAVATPWVARIFGPGADKILATALGPSSTVYGCGWFAGTPMFNGASVSTSSISDRDAFLARFNVFTGAVDLTRTYGTAGLEEISSAASLGSELVVTGHFDEISGLPTPGAFELGGTAQPLTSRGGHDVWVARLDDKGDGLWATRFGGPGEDRDPRIAIDAAGDVYVAGSFTGEVGFGAINLISNGGPDVFVVKLHGSDGGVAWAVSFGTATPTDGALNDAAGSIAVDGSGHVVVSATVRGPIDGGMTAGSRDAVITSFDAATGALHWRKVISTPGDDIGGSVVLGRNADIYALVGLGGMFDFGMPIIGPAAPTSVLLRMAP